jgi:uncharacterized protein YigA (DUF484 family)
MTVPLTADEVAQFLLDNPRFFEGHAELLTSITVPSPHGQRAISLVERQVDMLRDKNKALELRLAELVHHGRENDAIADKLQRWTRDLLRVRDARALPEAVSDGLVHAFSVPQVALRLWKLPPEHADLPCAAGVEGEIVTLVDSMRQPYCGRNADFQAARWLSGDGARTGSIALLPLRVGAAPESFGLLVLGSPDADRFQAGMGTAFLERIAEVASASLSRLYA